MKHSRFFIRVIASAVIASVVVGPTQTQCGFDDWKKIAQVIGAAGTIGIATYYAITHFKNKQEETSYHEYFCQVKPEIEAQVNTIKEATEKSGKEEVDEEDDGQENDKDVIITLIAYTDEAEALKSCGKTIPENLQFKIEIPKSLTNCSEPLKAMFTGGMIEATSHQTTLQDLTVGELICLVNLLYDCQQLREKKKNDEIHQTFQQMSIDEQGCIFRLIDQFNLKDFNPFYAQLAVSKISKVNFAHLLDKKTFKETVQEYQIFENEENELANALIKKFQRVFYNLIEVKAQKNWRSLPECVEVHLSCHPLNKTIQIINDDKRVYVFNSKLGLEVIQLGKKELSKVQFHPNKFVVYGIKHTGEHMTPFGFSAPKSYLCAWNLDEKNVFNPIKFDDELVDISLSPDGSRIATLTTTEKERCFTHLARSLEIFNASTGDLIKKLTFYDRQPSSIAFSKDGRKILAKYTPFCSIPFDLELPALSFEQVLYCLMLDCNASTLKSKKLDRSDYFTAIHSSLPEDIKSEVVKQYGSICQKLLKLF